MRTLPSLLALAVVVLAASGARADDDDGADHYVTRDMHMRSAPLVGGGIALATVGGLAIPVGALILMFPHDQPDCVGQFACTIDYTGRDWTGAGILAGGIAMVAAGIPMIVWGGRHVPVSITPSGPMGSSGVTLAVKF